MIVRLALAALTTTLAAQDQSTLIALRDAKLEKPWIRNAAWLTDYDEARQRADRDGKPIFAYFTRSYAP